YASKSFSIIHLAFPPKVGGICPTLSIRLFQSPFLMVTNPFSKTAHILFSFARVFTNLLPSSKLNQATLQSSVAPIFLHSSSSAFKTAQPSFLMLFKIGRAHV